MSMIILSLLALGLAGRAAFGAWRLWSQLPSRNADFGLVDDDFGLVDADTGGRP